MQCVWRTEKEVEWKRKVEEKDGEVDERVRRYTKHKKEERDKMM